MKNPLYFETSCVELNLQPASTLKIISFYSTCNSDISNCPHYITNNTNVSLVPSIICPLFGTFEKASVFLKIERFGQYLRDIFIMVDGCNFINKNGIRVETSWILTVGRLTLKTSIFSNVHFYDRFVVDDIFIGGFNRNCSTLCETLCTTIEKQDSVLIPIETYIYGVLIVFVIICCILCTFLSIITYK